MPTIEQQLNKLIELKTELANNLTVRGVEVSASATFNDLVPQVLNVEDVTDETTTYTDLNTELEEVINSLPSAESGGSGGSLETCTITFDNESLSSDCIPDLVVAQVLENGQPTTKYFGYTYGEGVFYTQHVSNVICGSKIYLHTQFYTGHSAEPYVEIDGSATYNNYHFYYNASNSVVVMEFTAPTNAGENCTIYYAYDPS